MRLSRTELILAAAGGSAAMLLAAFAFQHIGGMAPCKLCLWQRWPHAVAVLIGLAFLATRNGLLPWLGAMAASTTAVLGVYHTGVERKWWQGPQGCTGGDVSGMSAQDLLNQIMAAPLVRCDEVAWQMLGLSMPSWNALVSAGFAALWIAAALRERGA